MRQNRFLYALHMDLELARRVMYLCINMGAGVDDDLKKCDPEVLAELIETGKQPLSVRDLKTTQARIIPVLLERFSNPSNCHLHTFPRGPKDAVEGWNREKFPRLVALIESRMPAAAALAA